MPNLPTSLSSAAFMACANCVPVPRVLQILAEIGEQPATLLNGCPLYGPDVFGVVAARAAGNLLEVRGNAD